MTCSQFKGELQHRGKPWSLSKSFTETELSKLYSEKSDQSNQEVSLSWWTSLSTFFQFLLQAIVFAIFASLEQLPRFVSSLPSAGYVNDRHLANEWQNIKVESKSCSRSHGTRFLIDSCSRTRKRRIYAAAVTPWETFHTSWAKKLNLRINYNSRVLTSSKTARQHDYKSYGIVEDKTFGRQETISCLCYQHRFSNRPESLVLLEDCRRERKMLFLGKIHRNLGWFLC